MVAENDILRGIVLRQQKQEAGRAQTKKLVLGELAKLEINSKTLLKEIDLLSQPVVKLTPKELSLFRKSELQVSGTEISANLPTDNDPAPAVDAGTPKTANAVPIDRKSTRLNSSHGGISRMPSSA